MCVCAVYAVQCICAFQWCQCDSGVWVLKPEKWAEKEEQQHDKESVRGRDPPHSLLSSSCPWGAATAAACAKHRPSQIHTLYEARVHRASVISEGTGKKYVHLTGQLHISLTQILHICSVCVSNWLFSDHQAASSSCSHYRATLRLFVQFAVSQGRVNVSLRCWDSCLVPVTLPKGRHNYNKQTHLWPCDPSVCYWLTCWSSVWFFIRGGKIGLKALCLQNLTDCAACAMVQFGNHAPYTKWRWHLQYLLTSAEARTVHSLVLLNSMSIFPLKRGRKAVQKDPNQAARENSTHGLTGRSTNSKQTEHGFQCLDPVAFFCLILTECLIYFVVDSQYRVMQESGKRFYAGTFSQQYRKQNSPRIWLKLQFFFKVISLIFFLVCSKYI